MTDDDLTKTSHIFTTTAKIVGLVALVSLMAGYYVADRPTIVAGFNDSVRDPLTTGSLRGDIERAKLDPCVAPPRR